MTTAVKAGKVYGLRKMSNIDNIKNYTVIDLEMTGLSAKNDKIIAVSYTHLTLPTNSRV